MKTSTKTGWLNKYALGTSSAQPTYKSRLQTVTPEKADATRVAIQNPILENDEKVIAGVMNKYGINRDAAITTINLNKQAAIKAGNTENKIDYNYTDPRSSSYTGNSLIINPNQLKGKGARILEAGNYGPMVAAGAVAATAPLVAPTVAAMNTSLAGVPGLTLNNLMTAGFAGHGLKSVVTGEVAEPWKKASKTGNPWDYVDAASENIMTGLELSPLAGPLLKGAGEAINSTRNWLQEYNQVPKELPKQLLNSSNPLNLEELRKVYHNAERILQPEESMFLRNHGYGLRENYRTQNSNWNRQNNLTDNELNRLSDIVQHNNQLPPPPSEIQFMPDGTTRNLYNQQFTTNYLPGSYRPDYQEIINLRRPRVHDTFNLNKLKKPINKSGLTKEEAIEKASSKDKDIVSKMSETEFENTVLKPNGEIAIYKPGTEVDQMTYDLQNRRMVLKDQVPMSEKEYADAFNERLDLLNDIIAERNKSGVEYKVKELTPDGALIFETPEQLVKKELTEKQIANIEKFNKNPKEFLIEFGNFKKGKNGKWESDIDDETFDNVEDAITHYKALIHKELAPQIIKGTSTWNIKLNPGQWRGNVEDIANTEYFRSIPGLEMSNTTSGVFADNIPRKGTGAYESINDYLKQLNLGRVKPGFNSQSNSSRPLWENAVKSGKAVGFYANPRTVYGTMRSVFPYLGAGFLGYKGLELQQKQNGGVIEDNRGQWAHPGEVTKINSNNITMEQVPYPVLGIGADGEHRMMYPEEQHTFNQGPVTEYPMMQAKYGGWLTKYKNGSVVSTPPTSNKNVVSDENEQEVRNKILARFDEVIKEKEKPYNLPNWVDEKDKRAVCIYGVCNVMKDVGIMDKPIQSNTEFQEKASSLGFGQPMYNIDELKPGDIFQHKQHTNDEGNYYPSHAQVFKGIDPDTGKYEFYDYYSYYNNKKTNPNSAIGIVRYEKDDLQKRLERSQKKDNSGNQAQFYSINYKNPSKNYPYRNEKEYDEYLKETNQGKTFYEPTLEEDASKKRWEWNMGPDNVTKRNELRTNLSTLFNDTKLDEELKQKLKITDQNLQEFKPLIYGIINQESKFGVPGSKGARAKYVLEELEHHIDPKGVADLSYGPASIKLSSISPEIRKQFDINKSNDLYDPKKMYIAALDVLTKSKKYAKSYITPEAHPNLVSLNPNETALYWYNNPYTIINTDAEQAKKKGIPDYKISMDPGTYPDKVLQAAKELKHYTVNSQENPSVLPTASVVAPKKITPSKQKYGGWLNHYSRGGVTWLNEYASGGTAQGSTKIDWDKVRDVNDNVAVQAAKIFDPTGITSWPDIYYAIDDYNKGKGSGSDIALSILGALPVLGKLGKGAGLLAKSEKLVKAADKLSKLNKTLDKIEKIVPNVANVVGSSSDIIANASRAGKSNPIAVATKVIGKVGKGIEKTDKVTRKVTSEILEKIPGTSGDIGNIVDVATSLLNIGNIASDVKSTIDASNKNKLKANASPEWKPNSNDLRADGTKKGTGFLGVLPRPDGGVSSEISIGVEFDGKQTEIPTMVPTLSKEEIDYLLKNPTDKKDLFNTPMGKSIMDKAVNHAKLRMSKGLSPFYQEGEKQPTAQPVKKIQDQITEIPVYTNGRLTGIKYQNNTKKTSTIVPVDENGNPKKKDGGWLSAYQKGGTVSAEQQYLNSLVSPEVNARQEYLDSFKVADLSKNTFNERLAANKNIATQLMNMTAKEETPSIVYINQAPIEVAKETPKEVPVEVIDPSDKKGIVYAALNKELSNNPLTKDKTLLLSNLILAQTALETGDWKSPAAIVSNNFSGIKYFGHGIPSKITAPGSEENGYRRPYVHYNNPEEWAKDMVQLLTIRYPKALAANTPEEYAKALKESGYYQAPVSQYTKLLKSKFKDKWLDKKEHGGWLNSYK